MKHTFDTHTGSRHTPSDHSRDIKVLMDSLARHGVYTVKSGRTLDDKETPAVDVIQAGLQALLGGNGRPNHGPLAEYNTVFKNLQKRRTGTPVEEMGEDLPVVDPVPNPPLPAPPLLSSTSINEALDKEIVEKLQGIDPETDAAHNLDDIEEEVTLGLESVVDLDLEMDLGDFISEDEDEADET